MPKYHNIKITTEDGKFDSKREHKRWLDLKLLLRAGEISDLERQVVYELQPKFKDNRGISQRAITYKPDFRYKEKGRIVIEDVKGIMTQQFKLREKLFRMKFPDIDFRVIK